MFHGSLPGTVQQILGSIVREWQTDDIYIGCSGNYTIERMLKGCTSARLHSNDVTVYSCLLGRYLSGQAFAVKVRDDYDGPMRFVEKYMTDAAGAISVMFLLSKMALYLTTRSNTYYEKMIRAYIKQFPELHASTKAKLEKIEPFITSLYEGDVCRLVDEIPPEAGFICYPPFFSGDYEKMFKAIEKIFDWSPPEYDMIDKDRIHVMFEKMAKRKYFMFGTNDYLPEFGQYLVGMSQTTNRGVPLYIYANSQKSRIIMPCQCVQSPSFYRLGPEEDVGNTIKIVQLKSEYFHALRSQYMNVHISPGSETASYGVLVDEKLVGVYAFSVSSTLANWEKYLDTPVVYLLSDFPVAPSKYNRLAKLVLYAALSRESKMEAERLANKRIRSLVTTAFTKNPVSMKYRGLFKLLSKAKLEGVSENEADISKIYYSTGYRLNYGALMGGWDLQEGLAMWKKKHSTTEGRTEV